MKNNMNNLEKFNQLLRKFDDFQNNFNDYSDENTIALLSECDTISLMLTDEQLKVLDQKLDQTLIKILRVSIKNLVLKSLPPIELSNNKMALKNE